MEKYIKEQFARLASHMWPCGIAWGSSQHRDIVRVFLAGAFAADEGKHPELERLVMTATAEDWLPDESWRWPVTLQSEMN